MSEKRKNKRSNIFTKYFLIFVTIFLFGFLALGTTLLLLVNAYSIDEKTELLKENTSCSSSMTLRIWSVSWAIISRRSMKC